MASTYFDDHDLTLIDAFLATLPAGEFKPGSSEHTDVVHFLLRKFLDAGGEDANLPHQFSLFRAGMAAMNQALGAWQNEGGASAASGPKLHMEQALARPGRPQLRQSGPLAVPARRTNVRLTERIGF